MKNWFIIVSTNTMPIEGMCQYRQISNNTVIRFTFLFFTLLSIATADFRIGWSRFKILAVVTVALSCYEEVRARLTVNQQGGVEPA